MGGRFPTASISIRKLAPGNSDYPPSCASRCYKESRFAKYTGFAMPIVAAEPAKEVRHDSDYGDEQSGFAWCIEVNRHSSSPSTPRRDLLSQMLREELHFAPPKILERSARQDMALIGIAQQRHLYTGCAQGVVHLDRAQQE
jgi:hypothetical protein